MSQSVDDIYQHQLCNYKEDRLTAVRVAIKTGFTKSYVYALLPTQRVYPFNGLDYWTGILD